MMPGFTDTASALGMVDNTMMTTASGDRPGVDNFVLITTDGNSNILPENTPGAAQRLRSNARVMVAGVGRAEDINRGEINEIASDPDRDNTFFLAPNQGPNTAAVAASILDQICA